MCFPQDVILAIYGGSCTGKTTVAKVLAERLACPLRCCGELVREAATNAGVEIDKLPDKTHRRIDEQTVMWAFTSTRPSILEGRHLHYVLASRATFVFLVRLEASLSSRALRWQQKSGGEHTRSDVTMLDAADDAFRLRLYPNRRPVTPSITVDTTSLTPEETAQCVVLQVQATAREHD